MRCRQADAGVELSETLQVAGLTLCRNTTTKYLSRTNLEYTAETRG